MPFPRSLCLPAVLFAAGALTPASAQSTFVYAFNESGRVSANGYELDNLPDSGNTSTDELWRDLCVQGPDRWVLRGDGKLVVNGNDVTNLSGDSGWNGIVLNERGDWYAMKKDGKVVDATGTLADYPAGDFFFSDIETDGQNVYVLKSNGAVYRVPEQEVLVKFNGSGSDGDAPNKLWLRLLLNPVDGSLWALRKDGVLMSAAVPVTPVDPPDEGVEQASLPFDSGSDDLINEFYFDFTFAEGDWSALRADGRLYSSADPSTPLINFPGAPDDGTGQTYVSLVVTGGETFVLRQDGGIYELSTGSEIIDLKSNAYLKLVLGTEFPDLTNVKNQKPIGTSMSVVAPEGTDIELPVLAVDTDLPADQLEVAPVDPLPAGATWVEETRTISWPGAGPVGKYKIKVTVDDGVNKPVTTTQSITIKALDTNEEKNSKPSITKVSKATALVAVPFMLPVLAYDLDGTVPVLSVDTSKPLPVDAGFDALTGILTWDTPPVSDTGTTSFKFIAEDGTATTKRTLKVKVLTSLLGF